MGKMSQEVGGYYIYFWEKAITETQTLFVLVKFLSSFWPRKEPGIAHGQLQQAARCFNAGHGLGNVKKGAGIKSFILPNGASDRS